MTKAVFRPGEVEVSRARIVLAPPTSFPELAHLFESEDAADAVVEAIDVYSGPSADDLRREADEFRTHWEIEKEAMLQAARDEVDRIMKEAEEAAFIEVKRRTDEAQIQKQEAHDEAEAIIAAAHTKAKQLEAEARASFDRDLKTLQAEAKASASEEGFAEGQAEVNRLIQRMQTVLERSQSKRTEILEQTEQEIVSLVLLIARKVVKVISENQRNVIVSNVVQALRKLKARGNILIRVNVVDLKLTTEHIKDFITLVEGAKSINVVEDSSVDSGGCIIETDFGEIDARIASQLAELEAKILEISPLRSKPKASSPPSSPEPRIAKSAPVAPEGGV